MPDFEESGLGHLFCYGGIIPQLVLTQNWKNEIMQLMNKKRQLPLLISVVLIIVFGTIYFLNSLSQSKQSEFSIIPKINHEDE
jgi:hypothetical protein